MVGDSHGDIKNIKHKVEIAKRIGDIQRIVILGDFGFWWGHDGVKYLDQCNELAQKNNIQIFAIPGNHEFHEGWNAIVENAQATAHGWAYVRSNVLLSPKVHDFVWGGKQFVIAGGAVSIDRDYRIEYYRKKGKKIWSPNEQLTDAEVDALSQTRFAAGAPVDFLLTHDCSDRTPWKNCLKPDLDSQIHRQRIDRVLGMVKPAVHFHGHMHERYDWQNRVGGDEWVQTYGLECNSDPYSWGILDLATGEYTWSRDVLASLNGDS